MNKLICFFFGHKWVQGWITTRSKGVFPYVERHFFCERCARCGKVRK